MEPHKVLILEDLCELGYDTKRGGFLSSDELKAVFRKVSKLHAVSYMLGKSEQRDCITQYKECMFDLSGDMIKQMLDNGKVNFKKTLEKHDDLLKYMESFKSMESEIREKSTQLYHAAQNNNNADGDVFVLNHGDFHLKNMMFKYNADTKNLDDVMFVDYQLCVFAPSNVDLIYSQYTMLSPEFRLDKHKWMRFYFDEFIATLKKLNYAGELPKYSRFQIGNLKYRHMSKLSLFFGYITILTFFSFRHIFVNNIFTHALYSMQNCRGIKGYRCNKTYGVSRNDS